MSTELFYIPASRFTSFVGYMNLMGHDLSVPPDELRIHWNQFLQLENQAKG